MKIISIILIDNHNNYLNILDDFDLNNIKFIYVYNQQTDKKIGISISQLKSSSFNNGILRINRKQLKVF